MKKLIALLVACIAMTCVFASCGEDEKDESAVSKDTSVSEESSGETPAETENITSEYIDADAAAFLGKWECAKILADGKEIPDIMGIPVYSLYQYDVMEDGTAGISDSLKAIATEEDKLEYTWGLISENEIEIVGANGSVIQFTLDGDYLVSVVSESNMEIYLKKVDEFKPFDFQAFADNYNSQQNEVVLTPVETDADRNVIESSETITAE